MRVGETGVRTLELDSFDGGFDTQQNSEAMLQLLLKCDLVFVVVIQKWTLFHLTTNAWSDGYISEIFATQDGIFPWGDGICQSIET